MLRSDAKRADPWKTLWHVQFCPFCLGLGHQRGNLCMDIALLFNLAHTYIGLKSTAA